MALTSSDLSLREQPYWGISRGSRGASEHRNLRSGCLQPGTQRSASPTGFSASLCLCVHRFCLFDSSLLLFSVPLRMPLCPSARHSPLPSALHHLSYHNPAFLQLPNAPPGGNISAAKKCFRGLRCSTFHSTTHLPSIPWYQVLLWAVLLILYNPPHPPISSF